MTNAKTWLAAVCLIWAGAVIGVSFVATPAKFLAPTLSLSVAIDVGHHTFGVFRWIELTLFGLGAAIALSTRAQIRPMAWAALGAVAAILAAQLLWLAPLQDARAVRIAAGEQLSPTYHHGVYIALEVGKLCLLLGVGTTLLRGQTRPS